VIGQFQYAPGDTERECAGGRGTQCLDEELSSARKAGAPSLRGGKQGDGDRAPNAAHAVDRNGADYVVDSPTFQQQYAADAENPGDEPDDDGHRRCHDIGRKR